MDEQTQPVFENGLNAEQSHDQPQEGLSAPRRRLGRGISSLLGGLADGPSIMPENASIDAGLGEFTLIDHQVISRNPYQPRKEFDEASLAEMVESIAQHGILQPLLVRPFEGGYQLIAGERRLLAARRVGLAKVPCPVVNLGDPGLCVIASIENY